MYKIALILLVLIQPFKSWGDTFIQVGTGAYYGAKYVDLGYRWSRLNLSLGVGDIQGDQWEQFNLKFNYITTVIGLSSIKIQPINLGLSLLYTTDTDYFITNSSRYPEEDYYDFTALRAALTYQALIKFKQWSVYYDITWLDQGVYTQYNNKDYGDKFISWGAGISYEF